MKLHALRRNLFAALLLSVSTTICMAGGPFQILTGQSLGFSEKGKRYLLGDSAKSLLQAFGPSEQVSEDNYEGSTAENFTREEYDKHYLAYTRSHMYVNDGVTITEGRDGRVRGITFRIAATESYSASPARTDTGLSSGSSLRDVYRIYGEPFKTKQDELLGYKSLRVYYRRGDHVFSFNFKDGRLSSIGLNAGYLPYLEGK